MLLPLEKYRRSVLELLSCNSRSQEGSKSQMNPQCTALETVCHLYNYIFQDFHSFGNDTEAFKYINHDKQTRKMVCNCLSKDIRKSMSSEQCFLLQEAANCWISGCSTSVSSLFSSSSSAVLLLRSWSWSGINSTVLMSCMVKELQAHHYGGSHSAPKSRTLLSNTVKPWRICFYSPGKTWQYGLSNSKSAS